MLSKSEYSIMQFIDNVNSDTIDLMSIYFEKANDKHIEKYGEINSENNELELEISNPEYYEDSQSKYNKE